MRVHEFIEICYGTDEEDLPEKLGMSRERIAELIETLSLPSRPEITTDSCFICRWLIPCHLYHKLCWCEILPDDPAEVD
jgi:hypothetical protein